MIQQNCTSTKLTFVTNGQRGRSSCITRETVKPAFFLCSCSRFAGRHDIIRIIRSHYDIAVLRTTAEPGSLHLWVLPITAVLSVQYSCVCKMLDSRSVSLVNTQCLRWVDELKSMVCGVQNQQQAVRMSLPYHWYRWLWRSTGVHCCALPPAACSPALRRNWHGCPGKCFSSRGIPWGHVEEKKNARWVFFIYLLTYTHQHHSTRYQRTAYIACQLHCFVLLLYCLGTSTNNGNHV